MGHLKNGRLNKMWHLNELNCSLDKMWHLKKIYIWLKLYVDLIKFGSK